MSIEAAGQKIEFAPGLYIAQEETVGRRLAECDIVESSADYHTQQPVVDEVRSLIDAGYDVAFTDPHDSDLPDVETQEAVNSYVAHLEEVGKAQGRAEFISPPAMGAWAPLTKRAIALHTLYNAATARTLGDGIDPTVYDAPIFPGGKSASELIREEKASRPDKAEQIIDSYHRFVSEPIDDISRAFYQGSMDARAVRTRAATTIEEVTAHFANRPADHPLVSASLACGAAGPVAELAKTLEAQGLPFSEVILVDKDVMALASAASLADAAGIEDKVRIEHRDLLAEPLTNYIPEKGVDVVDLLGLFEYIPNDERRGPWAQALLQNVSQIVRPGGVIVFGNMLADRPQQKFFEDIVQWPRLEQRTVADTMGIIQAAGFDLSQVKVRIPAKEGVYAVYTISIPETTNVSSDNPYVDNPPYAA